MGELAHTLGLASCTVIPISALNGDNVVERSDAAPWYDGPTVLDALESAQAGGWASQHGLRQGNGGRLPGAVGAAPARRRAQLRRHGQRRPVPHRRSGHRAPPGPVHHGAFHRDRRRPDPPGRSRPLDLVEPDRRHRHLAGRPHLVAGGAADGDRQLRSHRVLVPRPSPGGRRPAQAQAHDTGDPGRGRERGGHLRRQRARDAGGRPNCGRTTSASSACARPPRSPSTPTRSTGSRGASSSSTSSPSPPWPPAWSALPFCSAEPGRRSHR